MNFSFYVARYEMLLNTDSVLNNHNWCLTQQNLFLLRFFFVRFDEKIVVVRLIEKGSLYIYTST